ncbi:MAG: hypothetical protein HGA25_00620 [Clostridiales bacterium]|nr:hypothetical protein [Clostridiales bacterium]
MNLKSLKLEIGIIFEKEHLATKNRKHTFEFDEDSSGIKYEHANTLIGIFHNVEQDQELKEAFIKEIMEQPYSTGVSLGFYTLIKINYVQEALDSLALHTSVSYLFNSIFLLVQALLNEDSNSFSLEELVELNDYLKNISISSISDIRNRDCTINSHIGTITLRSLGEIRSNMT